MKLLELPPIKLLRLSFVTALAGYALCLMPLRWGLAIPGLILIAFASAGFCLYLYKRWPSKELARESPIKWILTVAVFSLLMLLAVGVFLVILMI